MVRESGLVALADMVTLKPCTLFKWMGRRTFMKNITLSADQGLIEEARRLAATRSTTLNAEFRLWLESYVGRKRQAERGMEALDAVAEVAKIGGLKFTRDEMNERR